jgi:hypothetical protein
VETWLSRTFCATLDPVLFLTCTFFANNLDNILYFPSFSQNHMCYIFKHTLGQASRSWTTGGLLDWYLHNTGNSCDNEYSWSWQNISLKRYQNGANRVSNIIYMKIFVNSRVRLLCHAQKQTYANSWILLHMYNLLTTI